MAAAIFLCCAAYPSSASATFHFMHVELVIGGVEGDITAQAVQLRTRFAAQNLVERARIVVRDARGENPIVVADFVRTVSNAAQGVRILVASANFRHYTNPMVVPDVTMTHLIPQSYFQAGTLTFETDDGSFIVCRLCWGGSAYTGSTAGSLTNDNDGNYGPPVAGPLPTEGLQALLYQGSFDGLSSTNAADYALSEGTVVLTSNSGQTFVLTSFDCEADPAADPDHDADQDEVCADVDNCPVIANADQADTDGDGYGDACDLCPEDPGKSDPGVCGCGIPDLDANADNAADCDAPTLPPDDPDDDGTNPPPDDVPDDNANSNGNANDNSTGVPPDDPTDGNDNGLPTDPEPTDDDSPPTGGSQGGGLCGSGMLPVLPLMLASLVMTARNRRR